MRILTIVLSFSLALSIIANPIEDRNPETGCKPRAVNKPCYQIRDEDECLSSIDSRSAFANQNCVWCINDDACPNNNVCEPQKFMENRGKKAGIDFETCTGCKPRAVNKPCYQIRDMGECLSSIDSRSFFANQNCVWCLNDNACPDNNVCEPQKFLENRGKKAGVDFETCLSSPDNLCAILYKNHLPSKFEGPSLDVIDAKTNDYQGTNAPDGWDDEVSSFMVKPSCELTGYENQNKNGHMFSFAAGTYEAPKDDTMSSWICTCD